MYDMILHNGKLIELAHRERFERQMNGEAPYDEAKPSVQWPKMAFLSIALVVVAAMFVV